MQLVALSWYMLLKLEKGRESIVNKQQLDVGCGGLRLVTMFSIVLYSILYVFSILGGKE